MRRFQHRSERTGRVPTIRDITVVGLDDDLPSPLCRLQDAVQQAWRPGGVVRLRDRQARPYAKDCDGPHAREQCTKGRPLFGPPGAIRYRRHRERGRAAALCLGSACARHVLQSSTPITAMVRSACVTTGVQSIDAMPIHPPRGAFDALYREFLERGIRYCFPGVDLQRSASGATQVAQLSVTPRADGAVDLTWLG